MTMITPSLHACRSTLEDPRVPSSNSLTLINPTPYYLTVTELNAGTRVLENALVPPMGESTVKLPSDAGSNITYRTINDYGALTPKMTGVME